MVKQPVAGRVKTRLAREAGLSRALRFYRHATSAVIARLARDPRWQTILAVAPDTARDARMWPGELVSMAQGSGDLGRRMQSIFEQAPGGPVIIVGSDIPAIQPFQIARAFRSLGSHDAVFGPAEDGGYWLVGLKRRPRLPRPFSGVRWSTPHALEDSERNLEGFRVARAAVLSDVDDLDGLRRAETFAGRRVLPVPGKAARRHSPI